MQSLLITSSQPINEPALRVVVEVGCGAAVTREYVLLLDPPIAVEAPAPIAAAPAPVAEPPKTASTTIAASGAQQPTKASPMRQPHQPAARATRPSGSSTASAAEAATQSTREKTPAPARRGDRLKLVEPEGATLGGMRVTDTLASAPVAMPNDPAQAKLREDQARLAAVLQGQDPASVATSREAELSKQLQSLGTEIQALKKQMAEQAARVESERSQQAPMWLLYVLGGVAAASIVFAFAAIARARRNNRIMMGAPWWADTLMRTDAAKPPSKAEAAAPSSTAPVPLTRVEPDPDVVYPKGPVGPLATQPGRVSTRRIVHDGDAEFPDRVQDTTIEVHELGATQALQMLKRSDKAPEPTSPNEEGPLPAVLQPRDLPHTVDPSMKLSSLDFDLDAPGAGPTPPGNGRVETDHDAVIVPTLPGISGQGASGGTSGADAWTQVAQGEARASIDTTTPAFLTQSPQTMSWSDARQSQDYLRQVAESIEQADAYIAAGQAESAASVLRKLITEKQGAPRAPWLMLLQLYRKTEKRDAYEALAQRFEEQFARQPAGWFDETPTHEPGLDSDPDLLQAIWAKWGSAESMGLLSKLLYDNGVADAEFMNLTLQRDLLNFVKICPLDGG